MSRRAGAGSLGTSLVQVQCGLHRGDLKLPLPRAWFLPWQGSDTSAFVGGLGAEETQRWVWTPAAASGSPAGPDVSASLGEVSAACLPLPRASTSRAEARGTWSPRRRAQGLIARRDWNLPHCRTCIGTGESGSGCLRSADCSAADGGVGGVPLAQAALPGQWSAPSPCLQDWGQRQS